MKEKAIAVVTNRKRMKEFLSLIDEAGFDVVGILYVRRITTGVLSDYKLKELKKIIEQSDGVSKIIFDLELRPRQAYRIAKETKIETMDRIQLILRIFLLHAPSQEAKLQIKLASLRYELARAKEKVRLAKMGEQPGFSGLGAYEVDIYYNEIKMRISKILERISEVRKRRSLHRAMRKKKGYKTISITGYTCSGKTTLFNLLTNSCEKVGEEPFTTLSTKFKLIKIGPWKVYLSDTIGFISDLPPFMIHAFRSTLEEISFSDLVILMIDGSDTIEEIATKFRTSYNLLIELGVINKPIVVAINKIDLIDEGKIEKIKEIIQERTPYVVPISARFGTNINELLRLIEQLLGEVLKARIFIPYSSALYSLIDLVKREGEVISIQNNSEGIAIEALIPNDFNEIVKKRVTAVGGFLEYD